MPFLGLHDKNGREIQSSGYYRLDMSEINFKISPPKASDFHFTFVNSSSIRWPLAKETWPPVYGLSVFAEIDDKQPTITSEFPNLRELSEGDYLITCPGQLTMDTIVKPTRSNEPKEGDVRTEIERVRSDNGGLKEWCRKLIEGGTFPGEADGLRSLNSELVAALESIAKNTCCDKCQEAALVARAALAKVKEGK